LPARAVADTVNRYVDRFARAFSGVPRARFETLVRTALFVPESHRGVQAVVSGHDGSTWLRRGDPGSTATWMVFDEAGRHTGYVSAPPGLAVHAVTGTHVWGEITDQDDVPFLVRYRIAPMAGRQDRSPP
jgi:hypothetical protein